MKSFKLDKKSQTNLESILQLCSSVGIDSILIDEESVRGVNEEKSCVIISKDNIPTLNGNKIGLSRIGVLLARINLLKSDSNAYIEATKNEKSEITQLDIIATGAKVQFRCTSTVLIKAPKSVNDSPHWLITVPENQIDLLVNGVRTMGAKKILLTKNGSKCNIECADVSQDTFSISLNTDVKWVCEDPNTEETNFVYYYPTDVLLPVIKQLSGKDIELTIGENGTLTTKINSHPITIISQIME